MAAVRCAVRRLGGACSVVEEGRRLVPSRFLRSRQLSTKHAGKTWMEKKMHKLRAAVAEEKAEMDKWMDDDAPDELQLRVDSYGRAMDSLVHGAAKVALLCYIPYAVFAAYNNTGVEAQPVTKENQ